MDVAAPPQPSCFLKLPGTVAGPDDELRLGSEQRCVDYEGEIAVVLGRPARDIDPADATDVIAGLMLANDISARDVPMAHLALGKGSPGFCPLGPQLVTLDEIALDDVSFTVTVNGELRQQAHTSEMSHTFGEIVASFSHALPLDAGDVILTGTPAGVGVGMVPPRFLDDGDTVVIASPQLGTLRTTVSRPARAASPVSP
jgi:2-keto-4-pentenoate hydratase/2-oxohepta-3-ene-1,7-dioic acid hydratase in catechol pathway